ncbi:MAG: DUF3830 family protein, partial [Thiobacillus sp.]|nr:DUF3830 family protein [Thiobacillus sp.]
MAGHLRPSVAVVGGGWAGLAAATALADAGYTVHLHEAARQLGGRARTVDWNGLAIDNGQHLMAGAYSATLALMDRVGAADRIEHHRLEFHGPGFRLTLPDLPAPLHLAAGLLAARGLSLADRIAAARFMSFLKARDFRLDQDLAVFYGRNNLLLGPAGFMPGNLFATITEGLEAYARACAELFRE